MFIGEDEGLRQRGHVPAFMKESPTDPEFTRRVKRAANTIDMFRYGFVSPLLFHKVTFCYHGLIDVIYIYSIRLGVFLRRYPIARVFVIIYMVSSLYFHRCVVRRHRS